MARLSCFRLFWQLMRAAASRTFWTAGSNRPIRTAMIAMTTSSSISVNPMREVFFMGGYLGGGSEVVDDLTVVDQTDAHPVRGIDGEGDRPDRPVAQHRVEHAGVAAAEADAPERRRRRVRVHAVGLRHRLAEADVVLVPAGVVPHLVVAAGGAEDAEVALLLADHDGVAQ